MCVLVAEDEPLILELLTEVLENAGHEVHAVISGPEAIRSIDLYPGRFSALITDLHMPPWKTSGADVAKWMRKHYPESPIIITSATAHVLSIEWRRENRVDIAIKPYSFGEIVSRLAHLLT